VSRQVRPGVRHPSGTHGQFVYFLEIFFRQLRVCYFVTPSLARGRVCNLLLLLPSQRSPARVWVPWDLRLYFIVSILETPPTWSSRSYVGGPDILPGTGFPFLHLLRLAGLRWRYSIPPDRGILTNLLSKSKLEWQSKLHYDLQKVGHSILVSSTHLQPAINFSPSRFDHF
jgi:hypothetical protein